jgi:hypothetical protein
LVGVRAHRYDLRSLIEDYVRGLRAGQGGE